MRMRVVLPHEQDPRMIEQQHFDARDGILLRNAVTAGARCMRPNSTTRDTQRAARWN